MADSPAIEVQDLSKTYRDGFWRRRQVEALRGVSFAVPRGEIFGLLGPNGAGKTTLVKVLLGVVRASGGKAWMLGRPAGDRGGRRRVGYLPEHLRMPRHHTAASALAYYGGLSGMPAREIRRRAGELLGLVGLADWRDTPVRKFSKGMQQRLGIAQALLHDPELLMLDEPTDGVDPIGRSEMRSLLLALKAQGKTIFLNSHLLQELELVCDRVVILDHGVMLREGHVEELTLAARPDVQLSMVGPEAEIRAALNGHAPAVSIVGQASRLPDIPLSVAETAAPQVSTNGSGQVDLTLHAAEQQSIDALVDELRRRGVSIVSLVPRRQTLEEAFLSTLQAARRET